MVINRSITRKINGLALLRISRFEPLQSRVLQLNVSESVTWWDLVAFGSAALACFLLYSSNWIVGKLSSKCQSVRDLLKLLPNNSLVPFPRGNSCGESKRDGRRATAASSAKKQLSVRDRTNENPHPLEAKCASAQTLSRCSPGCRLCLRSEGDEDHCDVI